MPQWLAFLRAVVALAEGVAELAAGQTPHISAAAACVLIVLGDTQRRLAVLGGREGMLRSLGSVYGGSVTRFLGGFRGGVSRAITMPSVVSLNSGVAVSHDGSVLLVSNCRLGTDLIHTCCVHTGAFLGNIGGHGAAPLQFCIPCQVWVASDGFVFVADCENNRIQILTPRYDFYSFVGVGQLCMPAGVCANDDVLVVSEVHSLCVFNRRSGVLVRRFGSYGCGDGQLRYTCGLCFMAEDRHVAVADEANCRVSVFTLEGEFVRHMGVRDLYRPVSVACSDDNELVVADRGNKRIVVINAGGKIVWSSETSAAGNFCGVTVHGSMVFGQICGSGDGKCVVFS